MKNPIRTIALACALTLTPACASLQLGQTRIENPISAANTLDQRAYALLHAYAAVVEEATDIVADPATPLAFKRALGRVERVATPATETLQVAVTTYVRANADFQAASNASQTSIERAAAALSIAARRLNEAIAAAQAPIAELEGLVRTRRS
jgi:hypothetical protein